jgi:hypothetical protein
MGLGAVAFNARNCLCSSRCYGGCVGLTVIALYSAFLVIGFLTIFGVLTINAWWFVFAVVVLIAMDD